ncbi:hypothetical protein [Guptibacillus algicola]|uniref:hypothetical protein n=1 Tax=Guptibacillus algicola TaxID=225844 RepID=UPI001CD7AE24|nr:hypothetical protein [Alkalihalobacillus algicola]MCA0989498.1 hypothetical protein [Alkalihalobacillus algicola]
MKETIDHIVARVVEGIYQDMPELLEKFGERGRTKCREDNYHHIKHLDSACKLESDEFFIDYALWLNNLLTTRGMQTKHVVDNFERLEKEIQQTNEFEYKEDYLRILSKGKEELEELNVDSPSL